jgi:nitrate/TMAO reductase-like tetraheme cytochrome c subunit
MTDETAPQPAAEQPSTELSASQSSTEATAAEQSPPKPPRRKWWLWVIGGLGVLIVLFVFFLGSVTLLNYTESTPFCSLCHVMYPERTAYDYSPHSRVDCGTCHIGPGAVPAVQAKLANLRYLWVYPLNLYERPIPSPITSLRPTTVVCEQCHWPQKFYEDRLAVIPDYAPDEQNSLTQTELLMKTGGGSTELGMGRGIHWHIENPVHYIATDEKRQEIPWVQAEYNGKVTEYLATDSSLTADQIAKAEKRTMDCIDCHNRATHIFQNPDDAMDAAINAGSIPADLPYIKKYGSEVLGKTYATEAEAAAAIAGVTETYKTQHPDIYTARQKDIETAVAGIQAIFDRTAFPFMNLNWESHADNIGHKNFPGCFRCHDGKHLSADNQAIRLECNICHGIPQVADPGQPLPPIQYPSVAEPESHHSTTWLAEHRYNFDLTCAECHTVDNPGGSDNSSFCSNSACHATQWKYAGLNAPRIRELSAPPKVPSSGVPNPIPHPIGPTTDCKICHGPEGVRPAPENHASFTPDMCTGCHQPKLEEAPPTPTPAGGTPPEATPTPAAAGGPPQIPHPIEGRADCNACHGQGGIKPAPASHASFTSDMCLNCHEPSQSSTPEATPQETPTPAAAGGPPQIPHSIEGRADCNACHGQGGIKPAPASHASFTSDMCLNCHEPSQSSTPGATPQETPTPAAAGGPPQIPHSIEGRADCNACHGQGGIKPSPASHASFTSDMCLNCHQPAQGSAPTATVAPTVSATGSGEPPAIPHELTGRENCLLCHDPQGSVKPAPPDHIGRTVENCQLCHKPAQ